MQALTDAVHILHIVTVCRAILKNTKWKVAKMLQRPKQEQHNLNDWLLICNIDLLSIFKF